MGGHKIVPGTGKKYLYHLAFFLASIIIIVAISPREGKFKYEFQKGKPWIRPSLIAPWDFPVLKPEAVVARERDSVLHNLSPCFRLDTSVSKTQVKEFEKYIDNLRKEYESVNRPLSSAEYNNLKLNLSSILLDIYNKGILQADDQGGFTGLIGDEIMVITGRIAQNRPGKSVFFQKDAYRLAEKRKEEIKEKIVGTLDRSLSTFLDNVAFYHFVKPNLFFDAATTSAIKERLLKEISPSRGLVQKGELIISRGEIVNDSKFQILESLRHEFERRLGKYDRWLIVLGRIILVTACYLALYLFMYHFRFDVLSSTHRTFFIILIILIFVIITRLITYLPGNIIFFIPFAIIPILIRTFYDSRLALFVYLISIMLAGFIVPNSFEFVFISYMVGVIVIFSLTNVYKRARLFLAAFMVFLTYSIVYLGIGLMQEGSLSGMNWKNYLWFAGNGVLLLLAYPLIFVFEKTFSFVSDATLFELSDTNQPLLRKLSEEAPGSFQHSLQVANLASEAAMEIGCNYLLTRAGALYHDIGKIQTPEYFIENQSVGFSPHDQMNPLQSSGIIIKHVDEGVEFARKFKLPSPIIDFIQTHHGTTTAYYFYKKFLDQNPQNTDMEKAFAYSGPKPFSKETAIVMMADAVEASSRSLPNYSEENITELVERIIYIQEQDGQFSETPLTYKDISDIKRVFVKRLLNIYHARIAYPKR